MRVVFILATILVASSSTEEDVPSLKGMQHLLIYHFTPQQFYLVKSYENVPGFDFLRIQDDRFEVLVAGDQVELFKELLREKSIKYTVEEENVETVIAKSFAEQLLRRTFSRASPHSKPGLSFEYYPRYEEINEYLEYVASTYEAATLLNIGKSFEGRDMKGLKLSDGRSGNPAIFVDAGIHAREWIAPATALYIIDQLIKNPSNQEYIQGVDWYFIPLFNPDGYEYTHNRTANRMWRKTRSSYGTSNCRGVDGNRNFDMAWMTIGASSNPCSDIYAGPEVFSEPETRNVRDFILGMKDKIKIYLTLHSYGQYILYPWGYTRTYPKNEPELRRLAVDCAKRIAAVRNTVYTYGTSANHLYPSSGGSDDWAMDKGGADLAYTYELPGGIFGFDLPPSQIKPVGAETFEAFKLVHSYAKTKYSSRA